MSSNDPGQPEYLGSDAAGHGADAGGAAPRPTHRPGRRGRGGDGRRRRGRRLRRGPADVRWQLAGHRRPGDAIAYVSLDLDPSASQKIEAIKILRKFPGLRSELDISSRDDLRQTVFEEIQKSGDCTDLDYANDVEPWIGDRVALAAVPATRAAASVRPLVALQVTDQDKAKAGIRSSRAATVRRRRASRALGIAFVGRLRAALRDAGRRRRDGQGRRGPASLADDDDFTDLDGPHRRPRHRHDVRRRRSAPTSPSTSPADRGATAATGPG